MQRLALSFAALLLISAASACSLVSDFSDYRFGDAGPGDGGGAGGGGGGQPDGGDGQPDAGDGPQPDGGDGQPDAGDGPQPDGGGGPQEDAANGPPDAGRDTAEPPPCTPTGPELCDGEDNDCDPDTEDGADEDGFGEPCDGEDADLCPDGRRVCDGRDLICDDDANSAAEICDGEDNDCDPDTQDGADEPDLHAPCDGEDSDLCIEGEWVCEGGPNLTCSDHTDDTLDLCDSEDNDCNPDTEDGAGEEGFGQPCDGEDTDLCEDGQIICDGNGLVCDDDANSIAEPCDGQDNDCNPDTPDGADEPELDNPCDGPDTDFCEEGVIVCASSGALECSDATTNTVEICGNNEDEDCDGFAPRCLPPLNDEFPGPLGAAAAQDVFFGFAPSSSGWKVMCRSAKPDEIDAAEWMDCPSGGSLPVRPWRPAQPTDPANNGRTLTQVRFQWGDDDFSQVFSRQYYLHNSLDDADICDNANPETNPTLQELIRKYFSVAQERLVRDDTRRFDPEADLQLGNPFIQIRFSPPLDGAFEVNDRDGEIEILSLRRRFVLEPNDGQLVLMYRVYESRRAPGGCLAIGRHKHVGGTKKMQEAGLTNAHYNDNCDAIVLNQQGAGVCLRNNAGSIEFVTSPNGNAISLYTPITLSFDTYYCRGPDLGDPCADNLLWRKLVSRRRPPDGPLRWFSPKCFGDPTCAEADPYMEYLPDRGRYPDIFQ